MKRFSPPNLKYMRAFAGAWPDREIVQHPIAQLSWRQNLARLEKLHSPDNRLWYAAKTLEYGWSSALQIETQAHRRQGKSQTNFPATLPRPKLDAAAAANLQELGYGG